MDQKDQPAQSSDGLKQGSGQSAEASAKADSDYVRGGKGRRDEVGKTGIYPASVGDAPADAEVRGQEELGHISPHGQALQAVPKKDG